MNKNFFKNIEFDIFSATPKYVQLAQSVIKGIGEGKIAKDEVLPSINELSYEFDISRDTAEKAYRYLKKMDVLGSVPGKGYYVKSVDVNYDIRVFLMFNKLSTHKKIIYDSFVKTLGNNAVIDFYIYNNDYNLFKRLIKNADKHYTHFVIITHFMESGEDAFEILNTLPKEKLILLDKFVSGVTGEFSAVYENFESDIYNAMEAALTRLQRYKRIKIIVPEHTYFPIEITKGFKQFCRQYHFDFDVIHSTNGEEIKDEEVYICLREEDLVTLIEKLIQAKKKIGKEIGVISYNETPIKNIILDGITTISTDFELMGETTARLILEGKNDRIAIPFHLRLRPSL